MVITHEQGLSHWQENSGRPKKKKEEKKEKRNENKHHKEKIK